MLRKTESQENRYPYLDHAIIRTGNYWQMTLFIRAVCFFKDM